MTHSCFCPNRSCSCALVDNHARKAPEQGRPGFVRFGTVLLGACVLVWITPLQVGAQSPATVESRTALIQTRKEGSVAANRALYEAAAAGDILSMERQVRAGASLDSKIPGDGSPLIAAARNDRLVAVQWLLDHGADPNMPVPGDGNPLIVAARLGHIEVMGALLDRGARINQIVLGDENALIQASGSGHLDAVKLLISRGADRNVRLWVEEAGGHKGEWRSPLSLARKNGHSDVANYFLSIGVRD